MVMSNVGRALWVCLRLIVDLCVDLLKNELGNLVKLVGYASNSTIHMFPEVWELAIFGRRGEPEDVFEVEILCDVMPSDVSKPRANVSDVLPSSSGLFWLCEGQESC